MRIKPRRADDSTRWMMAALSRLFNWRDALVAVQADTLIRWHRKGFRLFWRWKSKPTGRPRLPKNLQELIRTEAPDALIHALPRLRKLFERASKDGPAYVAMWSLGPAQGRPDILRCLDSQTRVLTIDGKRADLRKLATEMMAVRDRVQTKARIGNPGRPTSSP